MTYQTMQQYNVTDLEGILTYTAQVVPIFIPMVLLSIFLIALGGTYFSQKRLTNKEDFMGSFAVAGYFTAIVSYIMMLIPDLINVLTVTVTTVVAIIGTMLLLINKE